MLIQCSFQSKIYYLSKTVSCTLTRWAQIISPLSWADIELDWPDITAKYFNLKNKLHDKM